MIPPPAVWQTVGPFFHLGMDWLAGGNIAAKAMAGQRVTIAGRVLDGDGAPVADALIETWQANAHGRYAHPEDRRNQPLDPGFRGFARVPMDHEGRFELATVKPGAVPAPQGEAQAPHIVVGFLARGLLRRLVTRIYFADEPANADDPVLALVAPDRRATLIANKVAGSGNRYAWDIVLQGERETVFFDC